MRLWGLRMSNNNNNNSLHLYSHFLGTQSTLHIRGNHLIHHQCAASTWMSHIAPERPPHTSLLVERRQSDEANQCMGIIRRPWQSEANGRIWPGCRGNTPTLFQRTSCDFNDHRESGPRFNVSSERRCFFDRIVSPSLYWGVRTHTDRRLRTPCWPH